MRGNAFDVENILALTEISDDQVTKAMRAITSAATDRADLSLLLAAIAPRTHTVEADPSQRRALPRKGLEA